VEQSVSKKKILVLDADAENCQRLCEILEKRCYPVASLYSLFDLEDTIEKGGYLAIIIDIDSVAVDNRVMRELTVSYPEIYFLCTSKDRLHPELKDAICYHIYACLTKPVDPDELFYWLRSINENQNNSNGLSGK
jgi:DNA-binding NtrC family response regulator